MQYRICTATDEEMEIIETFSNEEQLIKFINSNGFQLGWYIEVFKPTQYSWVVPIDKGYIERS